LLLTAGAALLIQIVNRLFRARVGVAWRFGLANIARRANASIAQILGIGLGIMVMLLLTLVRTDLLDSWRNRIPPGTPNYFLINIQSEDVTRLKDFLAAHGDIPARFYPMIRARLAAINGRRINPDAYTGEEGRRWARRGYNLTWTDQLPAANVITAGRWWSPEDAGEPLFSLEQQVHEELGAGVDDTLTFETAGREVTGRIASIRRVDWDSFNVNFFVVASPGALRGQPASYVTSIYLPDKARHLVIDLVKAFPSVTVYDVDALLMEVRSIMDQVVRTVEFVFVFTLLAGIVVLLAALQTTHDERSYESALLSALGAERKKILSSLTAEFFCIGLIAGILAAISATAVEMMLARFVFNLDISVNSLVWIIAPLICILVTVTGGLAGTWHALYTPPVVALRQT
jgi:putative ABC transport system permease protein